MATKTNTRAVELTNDQIIDKIYDEVLNKHDVYKDYVKNDDNEKELIKVVNIDGTINEKMAYGSQEFKEYVIDYIKNSVSDAYRILDANGKVKDNNDAKSYYNRIENQFLKIVRKPVITIKEGDPNYKPQTASRYIINSVGDFGFVNPGTKSVDGFFRKIENRVKSAELSLSDSIDLKYHQNEIDLFDLIHDWSRFSIIVPNFKSAPKIVSYFLTEFGGRPKVHDAEHDHVDRGYESIHINTNYKDINLEFQFHTRDYFELKKTTDIQYHAWLNVLTPDRSAALQEKEEQTAKIVKYCHMIYDKSDFHEFAPLIDDLNKTLDEKGAEPKKKGKLSHFCMAYAKATLIQEEIADSLTGIAHDLNKLASTELVYEK